MTAVIRVFKSLADPTRIRIVRLLLRRDLCVCELTFILKMSQSRVSHQLRILRDAGLAEDKRDGRWMIYGIPPGVRRTLRPLLELCGDAPRAESREIAEDRRRLGLCLRRDVRRTNRPVRGKMKGAG